MSDIRFFDSNDEMFNYLREEGRKAKEWAEEHKAVAVIDYFNYYGMVAEGLVIIGVKESSLLDPSKYDSEDEYNWEVESEKDNKEHGYVFARWYSFAVPDGELGSNHLSACHPLPDDLGEAILRLILERVE